MTPKKKSSVKVVKAWAVLFDRSKMIGGRGYEIDCIDEQCNAHAIYLSKRAAKEVHKNFAGKLVVPCTIEYQLPPKNPRV